MSENKRESYEFVTSYRMRFALAVAHMVERIGYVSYVNKTVPGMKLSVCSFPWDSLSSTHYLFFDRFDSAVSDERILSGLRYGTSFWYG